jgi:hypothetical protein
MWDGEPVGLRARMVKMPVMYGMTRIISRCNIHIFALPYARVERTPIVIPL